VALDVSRVVSGHPRPRDLTLEVDLLPALKEAEVAEFLQRESAATGKRQLAGVLAQQLPRRLCDSLLPLAGLAADRTAAALSKADRARLAALVKRLPIPLAGTLGFKKAEVTAGGVALAEVDSRTLQSKLAPGLFLAGEVLDLDGPIGGYNFQAAWSTGWLAGSSVRPPLRLRLAAHRVLESTSMVEHELQRVEQAPRQVLDRLAALPRVGLQVHQRHSALACRGIPAVIR
jgi:predicted Rossmann fold flavoprotein